jgi:hypothetical protein
MGAPAAVRTGAGALDCGFGVVGRALDVRAAVVAGGGATVEGAAGEVVGAGAEGVGSVVAGTSLAGRVSGEVAVVPAATAAGSGAGPVGTASA